MWHFWHFVSSAPTGHLYFPPGWVALTVRLKGPGHGQTAHPSHIMVGSVNILSLGLNINLLLQLGFLAGLVQKRLNPQMMAYHPRTVWKVDCPSHPTAWHLDWLPSCTGMTGIAAMRTGLCVRLEVLRQVLNIFFIKLVDEDKTSDVSSTPTWPKYVNLSRTQPTYQLESPLYPLDYPNMLDLETIFFSPPGTNIVIEFTFFNLENETICSYDHLTIVEKVRKVWSGFKEIGLFGILGSVWQFSSRIWW